MQEHINNVVKMRIQVADEENFIDQDSPDGSSGLSFADSAETAASDVPEVSLTFVCHDKNSEQGISKQVGKVHVRYTWWQYHAQRRKHKPRWRIPFLVMSRISWIIGLIHGQIDWLSFKTSIRQCAKQWRYNDDIAARWAAFLQFEAPSIVSEARLCTKWKGTMTTNQQYVIMMCLDHKCENTHREGVWSNSFAALQIRPDKYSPLLAWGRPSFSTTNVWQNAIKKHIRSWESAWAQKDGLTGVTHGNQIQHVPSAVDEGKARPKHMAILEFAFPTIQCKRSCNDEFRRKQSGNRHMNRDEKQQREDRIAHQEHMLAV